MKKGNGLFQTTFCEEADPDLIAVQQENVIVLKVEASSCFTVTEKLHRESVLQDASTFRTSASPANVIP